MEMRWNVQRSQWFSLAALQRGNEARQRMRHAHEPRQCVVVVVVHMVCVVGSHQTHFSVGAAAPSGSLS